jgi:hypothetical protein
MSTITVMPFGMPQSMNKGENYNNVVIYGSQVYGKTLLDEAQVE